MREIEHKIDGNYQIEQDTILSGMVTKDITIASGIHLGKLWTSPSWTCPEHGKQKCDFCFPHKFNDLLSLNLAIHPCIAVTSDLIRGSLDLRGMVAGNLVAKTGSSVNIYGTVVGTVIDEGAEITIYGTVGSINNTSEGAQTQVASGAVVREN